MTVLNVYVNNKDYGFFLGGLLACSYFKYEFLMNDHATTHVVSLSSIRLKHSETLTRLTAYKYLHILVSLT